MSKNNEKQPNFTKAIDIKSFFLNELGACDCSEISPMVNVIRNLLEWMNTQDHPRYDTLFNGNTGVYYILIGLLDNLEICEHGIAIRYPWLTDKGQNFLKALQTISTKEIDECKGKAYDGIYY